MRHGGGQPIERTMRGQRSAGTRPPLLSGRLPGLFLFSRGSAGKTARAWGKDTGKARIVFNALHASLSTRSTRKQHEYSSGLHLLFAARAHDLVQSTRAALVAMAAGIPVDNARMLFAAPGHAYGGAPPCALGVSSRDPVPDRTTRTKLRLGRVSDGRKLRRSMSPAGSGSRLAPGATSACDHRGCRRGGASTGGWSVG